MAALLGPNQVHGQAWWKRFDPCYNAPVSLCCGCTCSLIALAPIYFFWDQVSTFWDETSPWFWVGVVVAALVLYLGCYLVSASFSQSLRRRMRMGKWPVAEPSSIEEIVSLLKSNKPPIAVGDAWKYHLSGRKASADEVSIALGANWAGVVHWTEDTVRVRAGTLWGEVIQKLWEKNRAPVDRPAYDGITIGASVRVAAHGWTLDGWFIEYVTAIQAVERGSGFIKEVKRNDSDFFAVAFGEKWIITEVEMKTQANRLVEIHMKSQPLSSSTTMTDMTNYLNAEMPANWRFSALVTMHIEPTKVERKWVTFDPVATEDQMTQTCWDFRARFLGFGVSGIDSLSDAMTSIQTAWIIETLGFRWSGNIDIELLVVGYFDWDMVALTLSDFHRKFSVRTDLRERTRNGVTITGFDAVIAEQDLPAWFKVLHDQLGVRKGAIHPGKHVPATADKIQLLDYGMFWESVITGKVTENHDGTRLGTGPGNLECC